MKKIMITALSLLMSTSILVGCSNTSKTESGTEAKSISVNVGAPDGLPAIAISKLAGENTEIKKGYDVKYNLEASSDELSTDVMKEALDIAIVPSNMASIAYNKTSNYQVVATVGTGSFYLVTSDSDVTGIDSSLVGKEVGTIGKGLTPDITIQTVLKEQGIDPSSVTFNYSNEASDLVPLLATGKLTTGIVPEPALSGLLTKNPDLKVITGLNDTWKDVFKNENGYPQSTLIVKTSFANENTEFIDEFIKSLDANISWTNENPDKAATYAEQFGVSVKAPVLEKAIERMNLKLISIKDCKDDYVNYYNILSSYNQKVLGGAEPDDNIYYTN